MMSSKLTTKKVSISKDSVIPARFPSSSTIYMSSRGLQRASQEELLADGERWVDGQSQDEGRTTTRNRIDADREGLISPTARLNSIAVTTRRSTRCPRPWGDLNKTPTYLLRARVDNIIRDLSNQE